MFVLTGMEGIVALFPGDRKIGDAYGLLEILPDAVIDVAVVSVLLIYYFNVSSI